MPLIDLAPTPLDTPFVGLPPDATADQQAAHEQARPEFSQTLGSAFRQTNQIGSFLSRQDSGMPGDQEPGFDAWDAIKGTPYQEHWDSFVDVHNRKALGMRKAQIDMETKDRETLAQSGWVGTVASIGTSMLDPTMLLPVGGAISKIGGGVSVARTALATGADVAAAVAVQEAGLQASQHLRTPEESAWAIGTSALLGTFIGAGAAALLSRGEQRAAEAAIDRLRESGGSPILSDVAEPGARKALAMPADGTAQPGGAEAVVPVTREDLTVAGGAARRVAETTAELNPNLRLNTSPSTEARKIGQQLAENTLFQNQHAQGESLGPAAETLMRTTMHGRMAEAQAAHNAAFLAGRKAKMQMTRAQFEDAVGEAMRRGDEGENEFVTQAAQAWRQKMFDPFKDEAINEGLLPADVKVDTADSYFRRLYNQQRLTAQESDFKARVTGHYDGLLQSEYAGDIERHASRIDTLSTEAADLKLSPEDRTAALSRLEQDQQQLIGNSPEHVDRADQIARLREDMAAAKEKGDKDAYKVAQEQSAKLRTEGGEKFQTFLRQRANLNARLRNVEMNAAGLAERADTVLQTLADIEEANARSMQRLITKGRIFERDAQRLDPEKFAAKVDDLRNGIADQAARAQKASDRARKGVEKIATDAERRAVKAEKQDQRAVKTAKTSPLLDFIIKSGGIRLDRDSETLGIDHISLPGLGKLVRKDGGVPIDKMREMAAEAGYPIGDHGSAEANMAQSNLDDLLQAIDQDHRARETKGERVTSIADQGMVAAKRDAQSAEAEKAQVDAFKEHAKAEGLDVSDNALMERAAAHYYEHGLDPADAVDMAVRRLMDEEPDLKPLTRDNLLPGWDDEILDGTVRGSGAEGAGVRGENAAGQAGGAFDPREALRNVGKNGGAIEGIKATELRAKRDADITAKLEKEAISQAGRAERMSRLADRLEQAQSLDPEAMLAEVRAGVDRMVAEVSNLSLSRGEKAQRLLDKLKTLDPKRIDDRLKAIEDLQKDFERKFYAKWEIDRGGAGIDIKGMSRPDFAEYSRDIANAVYEKLTGRGYDNNMPDSIVPATRGPLKERTFHIPDKVIEPFLESNVIHVAHDYARKMASEIELTRRFGSADMKEPLQRITNEYEGLRKQVAEAKTTEEMRTIADRNPGAVKWLKEKAFKPDLEDTRAGLLQYLTRSERQDAEDVQAMRDLLRGTYKKANMNTIWGRVARGVLTYNYITRMGGVLLANISEVFRPAMVYGMRSLMQEGFAPLLSGASRAAMGMAVHEAQLAGQVVERVIQHRIASYAEMGDPYASGTAIERLLEQGSRVASRWNFLTAWTDGMKAVTSVLAQNRILRAVRDGGEDRTLAYLGIDKTMRARIADQVAQHAEEIEGVMVANTEKWDDAVAVRTYRAAMSKDVDSVIVTRSVGDVPLFANTPTGKLITQFKSFALASHQRVLLRGLQDNQARFFGGMVAMTAMGGLATYLRAISTNRLDKVSQNNPGWWLAEGIDQTGIFAVPLELANILEKPTGINVLKDPLRNAGAALTGSTKGPATLRYGSRGDFGALLGPGMGQMDDLFTVIKTLSSVATGGDVQAGQKKAAVDAGLRQTPFYSYPGMRQMIEYLAKPAAYDAVGAK